MTGQSNNLLTISQFATLTGISRPNLIFYDKEGLLKPALVRENGYRMYDYKQVSLAYKIVTFRRMGLSIEQVRTFVASNQEQALEVMDKQCAELDRQIAELRQQRFNLDLYRDFQRRYADRPAEGVFGFERCGAETMLVLDCTHADRHIDSMTELLMWCRGRGTTCDCHIGRIFSRETEHRDWSVPEHVFFRKLDGPTVRPAGTYLTYTCYSDGTDINERYRVFFAHVREASIPLAGDVYEDCPLAGIFASDRNSHLLRIAARVA